MNGPRVISLDQRRRMIDKLRIARQAVRGADRLAREIAQIAACDAELTIDMAFGDGAEERASLANIAEDVDRLLAALGVAVADHKIAPEVTSVAQQSRAEVIRRFYESGGGQ